MTQFGDMYKPNLVEISDPIISGDNIMNYPVLRGGVETNDRVYSSNNFSNSNLTYAIVPPDPQTFVSRRFIIRVPIKVTLQADATSADDRAFRVGFDGFKQFPLATMMNTLRVSLNGQSVSLESDQVIKPLLLYHNNARDLGDRNSSMSPAMRDQSQNYNDLVALNGDATSLRNPLNSFKDSLDRAQIPRGSFSYDRIVSTYDGGAGTVTDEIYATLTEELLLSPLLFGGVRDRGFIGLQKIDIYINWINDLTRVWAHASNADTLPNWEIIDVSLSDQSLDNPAILFRFVTPPIFYEQAPFYQYNYNEINYYSKSIGSVSSYALGATSTDTMANIQNLQLQNKISDNIQLNAIPRFLYIFIRQKDVSAEETDSYAAIEGIKINWTNHNALLSNASQQQIYDICRKNGVDMTWNEWSGYPMIQNFSGAGSFVAGLGSVICLEFGTDIGLKTDEVPGIIGTYNLQVEVNFKNYSGQTRDDMELMLITSVPGIFTIYNNSASSRIGLISKEEVDSAKPMMGYNYHDLEKNLMNGGFNFRKNFRKVSKFGRRKALPYIAKKALPKLTKTALKLIEKQIGIGGVSGGLFVGGRKKRKYKKRKPMKKKRKPGRPKKK